MGIEHFFEDLTHPFGKGFHEFTRRDWDELSPEQEDFLLEYFLEDWREIRSRRNDDFPFYKSILSIPARFILKKLKGGISQNGSCIL
jgi:hypothetical protein